MLMFLTISRDGVSDELQPSIPDSEKNVVLLAKELRLDKHDPDGAEKILNETIQKHPDYYKAHYNLGLVYQDKGDYDRAIAELDKARSIRESQNLPEYSIYNTLGWVCMQKGDTKAAENYYVMALQYEPRNTADTNTRLYNNLSWLYYTLGDAGNARKYANIAAEKYHSTSASELKRLIDQLEADKKKIKATSEVLSRPPADTAHP